MTVVIPVASTLVKWVAVGASFVIAVGIVAGCSSSETKTTTSTSGATFRSSVGKVCRKYGERLDRIRGLRSSEVTVLATALTKAQVALIEEAKELERLRPPPGVHQGFARLLARANVRFRFLGLITGTAAKVGRRALTEMGTGASWQRMTRDYRLLADRLGLGACGHQLNLSP
jgi:hypothetical protein